MCAANNLILKTWQLQKGASSARSDDTKSLKGVIVDWISPVEGEPLRPQLARNVKVDRGFNHERTGFLLCPPGIDWSDPQSVRLDSLEHRCSELISLSAFQDKAAVEE